MSKSCQNGQQIVKKFSKSFQKVFKSCQKVVKKMSKSCQQKVVKSSLKKAKIANFEVEDETCGRIIITRTE
jgi:hypothetical protein